MRDPTIAVDTVYYTLNSWVHKEGGIEDLRELQAWLNAKLWEYDSKDRDERKERDETGW